MKVRKCAILGWAVAIGVALSGCSDGGDGASVAGDAYDKTLGSVEAAPGQVGESATPLVEDAQQYVSDTADSAVDSAVDSATAAADEKADGVRKAAAKADDAVVESIDSAGGGLEDARSDLTGNGEN